VLPGLHLIVFAPAGWPEDELSLAEAASQDSSLSLTPREVEVLELAAEGNGAAEIAERLALSTRTVDTHFEHIYAKLGVHNRTGAVASAMRLGLIDC
jgi:DNA-binding NarL/FixJ family response regulator